MAGVSGPAHALHQCSTGARKAELHPHHDGVGFHVPFPSPSLSLQLGPHWQPRVREMAS